VQAAHPALQCTAHVMNKARKQMRFLCGSGDFSPM
jgi:hypothetical protein